MESRSSVPIVESMPCVLPMLRSGWSIYSGRMKGPSSRESVLSKTIRSLFQNRPGFLPDLFFFLPLLHQLSFVTDGNFGTGSRQF